MQLIKYGQLNFELSVGSIYCFASSGVTGNGAEGREGEGITGKDSRSMGSNPEIYSVYY